ncbi:MAG: hypothetical protein M1814_000039 [Vezdaea aestivalis]|nr:MAG: hypothetical protein M1814_000039 [Vezdaea aestivalis]
MPLLPGPDPLETFSVIAESKVLPVRRQSQHSVIAKSAIMTSLNTKLSHERSIPVKDLSQSPVSPQISAQAAPVLHNKQHERAEDGLKPMAAHRRSSIKEALGSALTDTPRTTPGASAASSTPGSPRAAVNEFSLPTARSRPTTLDIPGLTRSKASPDGKIAKADLGAKLVIVMVGLPARGKSYVTKKIARYLNWLQHDTRIFNVGERRRVAAGGPGQIEAADPSHQIPALPVYHAGDAGLKAGHAAVHTPGILDETQLAATILINGSNPSDVPTMLLPEPSIAIELPAPEGMDQSAQFFDPCNIKAAQIREQVAMETLDELLDYIMNQGGSVGIFDATNSTLERRKAITKRIRERAGPELGVLFLESLCLDEQLLESNMRLKLSGPDYKNQDPVTALADFRERVTIYEKNYVPLGEYEEKNGMQYVQMIDVGRKVVSHQIRGFLSGQTVYYLLNFNLAPRQIWITRHGESIDNVQGKIGGDSSLSEKGHRYAKTLAKFLGEHRKEWEVKQKDKAMSTHFPPLPGDTTPPNPTYGQESDDDSEKNFCVWTSMLKRSIETAAFFDDEEYAIKEMRMLDELNSGKMEGMTYEEIRAHFPGEYELRKHDKLHYRYPGAGGESYLDIINRLRTVIVEVERMTDHVLLVGHRSVVRVLLAYFKGLNRDDVADLDAPLGVLYVLEPKPYGVEFKAYRYNEDTDWFEYVPDYELRRAMTQTSY